MGADVKMLILLALVACTTTKHAESSASIALDQTAKLGAEAHADASGEEHRGPERETVTVEEFEAAPPRDLPTVVGSTVNPALTEPPQTVPARGPLVKRTTTIIERGPADSAWRASGAGFEGAELQMHAQGQANAHSESVTEPWHLPLWGIVLAALAALGVVFVGRRIRKAKPAWLGWLWKLIACLLIGTGARAQTAPATRPGTSATTANPVQGVTSGVPLTITCPDGTCSGGGGGGGLTDAQLRATPVPISGSIANTTFGATQGTSPWVTADNHTTAASPLSCRASDGSAFYDARQIRALTVADVVGIGAGSATIGKVDQGTAGASAWLVTGTGGTFPVTGTFWPTTAAAPASHRLSDGAAFYDAAKTGQLPSALVSGRLDVNVGAALPAGTAVIGHVIADTGSTTAVTGNVTAVQATGTNLHAVLDTTSTTAVTQATGTNLHAVLDTTSTTAVTQATAANLNATVVLAAGSALAGKVGIDQTTPGTTNAVVNLPTSVAGGATTTKVVAVNTTTNVKASAGNVYGMSCLNANASACFIQFYNTAGSPTCGTAVIWYIAMPTSGVVQIPPGALALANHATGIGMCMGTTATGATACTTANSCTIFYQ